MRLTYASIVATPALVLAAAMPGAAGAETASCITVEHLRICSTPLRFAGTTSQGDPVHFLEPINGDKVVRFRIAWTAKCVSGASFAGTSSVAPMRVTPFSERGRSPRLRFGSRHITTKGATYSATPSSSSQVSATVTGSLGFFNEKTHGTWSAQVRVLDPAKKQIDTCKSGAVTWTAAELE